MPGVLVVTHGRLADELVAALQRIVGEVPRVEALSIGWSEDVTDVGRRVEEALARVDGAGGVLILTDMFGGTPTNLALAQLEHGRVEIVTGVNLPMLVKLASLRDEPDVAAAATAAAEQGRQSIQIASQLLERR